MNVASDDDIVDPSEWARLCEAIDIELDGAQNEINDSTIKGMGAKQKRVLSKKVFNCKDSLLRLERSLPRLSLGDGEMNRRRNQVNQLKTRSERIEQTINLSNMGRGGRRGVAPEESEETASISNSQLYAQQKSQLEAQDAKLDGILDGVGKLKVMSTDINKELNLHQHLLSELDGAVESTDARIQRNTKRIGLIQESSGGWCGLIIMFILFVIIVLLLSTNYGCHVFKPSAC